jgi:uncharacterized protein YbjT (DUF2867 family)
MRILIVGATGGLGQDTVAEALARSHETAALVRNPGRVAFPETVEVVQGDVLDTSSLRPAFCGRDAVICALGTPSPRRRSTLLQEGTKNLVVAMSSEGVRRLVCVTLLGTGSGRANASFFYREVILRVLAPMLPDKEAQEQAVRASDLDWVLVRPPRFVAGKRGSIRVIREGERGRLGHVVRADLAPVHCGLCHNQHLRTRGSDGGLMTLGEVPRGGLADRAPGAAVKSDVRSAIGKDKGDNVCARRSESDDRWSDRIQPGASHI